MLFWYYSLYYTWEDDFAQIWFERRLRVNKNDHDKWGKLDYFSSLLALTVKFHHNRIKILTIQGINRELLIWTENYFISWTDDIVIIV